MVLRNDTGSIDNINSSNTIQLMQLFDLSRPKDIMIFIEVEPDNCDDTNSTNKKSGEKTKMACPLSKKRKSVNKNNSQTIKRPHLLIDKEKSSSQILNEYYKKVAEHHLKNKNETYTQTVQDTNLFPVSNYTQSHLQLITSTNRLKENSPDQREQTDSNNFNQRQISRRNVNLAPITNHTSSAYPPLHTPDSSINQQNLNQIHLDTKYGLNVIIEQVFNFLSQNSQDNSRIIESRLQLFQRCYAYVVNYCLDLHLNNICKILNYIVLNVVSIARNRSHYINQKQTRLLLEEMFDWCRQKRSIKTNVERNNPLPYYPPPYNTIAVNRQSSTLLPHIRKSLAQNNSNKSLQINNEMDPAINKDQTCLFTLGNPGREISINVDTSLYHTLQNNAENTLAKPHQSINIHEKETPNFFQPANSAMTTLEIFPGLTMPISEKKDNTNELQSQPELARSRDKEILRDSVSRDSGFISPSNINNQEDRLISFVQQSNINEEVMPIITHITSLNSNAFYISIGLCSVCKEETNKRCIGCYKVYYCSRECQLSEWSLHKILCNATH